MVNFHYNLGFYRSKISFQVKHLQYLSCQKEYDHESPKKSSLALTLFNIFIDDIHLPRSNLVTPQRHRDLFSHKNLYAIHNIFQLYLLNLDKYFMSWRLQINSLKKKIKPHPPALSLERRYCSSRILESS